MAASITIWQHLSIITKSYGATPRTKKTAVLGHYSRQAYIYRYFAQLADKGCMTATPGPNDSRQEVTATCQGFFILLFSEYNTKGVNVTSLPKSKCSIYCTYSKYFKQLSIL